MRKQLLTTLMLSTVLATSLNAASTATQTMALKTHVATASAIPQQIATIETTATVEVSAAQQATLETTQNILIGGGVVAAFLFPKATITLAVGYFAYAYFFGHSAETTAPAEETKEPTQDEEVVIVPPLNLSSLSPLQAEDSHRHMEKDQTARAPHAFSGTNLVHQSMEDLDLVAVNLTPQADVVMDDTITLPALDLSFLTAQRAGAQTARSESQESTTSTTAAVVTQAGKGAAAKGNVETPSKPVITPRVNKASELLKKANTSRAQGTQIARPAVWR